MPYPYERSRGVPQDGPVCPSVTLPNVKQFLHERYPFCPTQIYIDPRTLKTSGGELSAMPVGKTGPQDIGRSSVCHEGLRFA
jgi:hypothetical protein